MIPMHEGTLHLGNLLLILIVLIDLFALGTSRLTAIIGAVALQGGLLATLPLALHGVGPESLLLAAGTFAVKAIIVPRLMLWAIREATIRREVDPLLGFVPSLLLAGVGIGLSFALAQRLPLRDAAAAGDLVPAALSTVFCGRLLIGTRKKAITQVAGVLGMEHGIYLIGLLLSAVMPWMVEAGVLLDLFAAIFVMGIVVYHINREFASTDTAKLTSLRD